jgi:CelD/BcsL family acetyltransferase involved in cellulose biosynthesis
MEARPPRCGTSSPPQADGERARHSFDFGRHELYKRDWSDKEVKLYDHLAPVTFRGQLAVCAIATFRRTKRLIKQTPLLWRAYSALRSLGRLSAGQSPPVETE